MRSIRAMTYRAAPDARELSLLRAAALEVLRFLERTGRIERSLPPESRPVRRATSCHATRRTTPTDDAEDRRHG